LCRITLASILLDEAVFVGAEEIIIITIMLIVEIMETTVIPQVSNLGNRDTDSPQDSFLDLPLGYQDNLGNKVTILVGIIAM
jgi:hypothetical protein